VDELLERVLDAHGGLDNWSEVTTLRVKRSWAVRFGRREVGLASTRVRP
jgi:hypothetical protein